MNIESGMSQKPIDIIREATKENFEQLRVSASTETEEYRKDFSEILNNLTNLAIEAGFSKLLVSKKINKIECFPGIEHERILFYPYKCLENHKILEKIDSKFAENGAKRQFFHEEGHMSGPAKSGAERWEEFYYDIENKHGNLKEPDNVDYDKLRDDVESQANLQMLNKNISKFKDNKEDGVIDNIAIGSVYLDIVYYGLEAALKDQLDKEIIKGYYKKKFKFLTNDNIDKIADKEIDIKKELLEKYNKLENIRNT